MFSFILFILKDFFLVENEWYVLGASMTEPIFGGLGEYVAKFQKFTPRHASAIVAILVEEGLIIARGRKPIEIRRVK